jgi:hypothetical protein
MRVDQIPVRCAVCGGQVDLPLEEAYEHPVWLHRYVHADSRVCREAMAMNERPTPAQLRALEWFVGEQARAPTPRTLDTLVRRGWAEDRDGAVRLTPAGHEMLLAQWRREHETR